MSNLPAPRFTPEEILRRKRVIYPMAALVAVLLSWGMYISAAAWRVDWLKWGNEPTAITVYIYLLTAVVMTIVCAVVAYKAYRLAGVLLQRGVQTHAVVVKISSMAGHGSRPVTLAYHVQGRQYTIRRDLPEMYVSQFTPSTCIPILYDPQQPERCELLNISASVPSPQGTWKDNISEALRRPLVAVLYIVNAVALYGLMRLMEGEGSVWMMSVMLGAGALTGLEEELLDRVTQGDNPLYSARLRRVLTVAFAAGALFFAVVNVRSHNREIERQRQSAIEREQWNRQVREVNKTVSPEAWEWLQKRAAERKTQAHGKGATETGKPPAHP